MSDDWYEDLSEQERDEFDKYVDHFRRETLSKIVGSAAFASVLPSGSQGDPKFWMELGAAIMFDKPLIAIIQPGQGMPPKMRLLADKVVVVDIDTEDGQARAAQEIAAAVAELVGDG